MVSGRCSEYLELGVGTQHAHVQCATAQEHAVKFQAKRHGVQRSAAPTCRVNPTCKVELPAFRLQRSTTNADILKITPAVVLTQLCLVEDTGVSLLRSDGMVVQVPSRMEGITLGCLFSAFSVHRRHTVQC